MIVYFQASIVYETFETLLWGLFKIFGIWIAYHPHIKNARTLYHSCSPDSFLKKGTSGGHYVID